MSEVGSATVSLDLDTSKFDAKLAEVEKRMRETVERLSSDFGVTPSEAAAMLGRALTPEDEERL